MKLYCFPHAGGTPGTYLDWLQPLTNMVELVPVFYKSRELTLGDLVQEIASIILNQSIDETFAFIGHSFGSLVAFEVAIWLQDQGVSTPVLLILSGKRPLIYSSKKQRHVLCDEDFYRDILSMGNFSNESRAEKMLLKLFLHRVRADFKMSETYRYPQDHIAEAEIIMLNGLDDPETNNDEMDKWDLLNRGNCEVYHFTGNHFFIFDHQTEIIDVIRNKLTKYLSLNETEGRPL
ncbi:thioesterase II family protein [Paenibacillus silvae]|uniref:thioesterase II family protein n=1 Tax=Paenibacillus silvae TaxID=1325358 RepID=UPI002002A2DC|nr:thioesterase domain-containing protein [Paenibacillus silvae]MCK6076576.1 hypothetical protein [Paenibacillus silvae]MCK6151003.1 hypothetical protein [Paenibacillus silvae]MCK6269263.1 hypothetical protein [Paenibacillus silvae]